MSLFDFFFNLGTSFCSAFISAAKHSQAAQNLIESCEDKEVKSAVFKAVRGGEQEKCLEFLRVCFSMHLLQCALNIHLPNLRSTYFTGDENLEGIIIHSNLRPLVCSNCDVTSGVLDGQN